MRPVFVGDVQGCADELDELLARVEERLGSAYEVWLVGDLVNRGPASLRALERARELVLSGRARVVLGNHDLSLLRVHYGLRPLTERDTFQDVLATPGVDDLLEWLRRQPLAAGGTLGGAPFAMVHASVHPDWSEAEVAAHARAVEAVLGGSRADARALLAGDVAPALVDDLGRLTTCRSVGRDGSWSPEEPTTPDSVRLGRVAWHAPWSERGHRYGAVYGHWAMQGLHVANGLRGIDTGCVHDGPSHAGYLTAWLPDPTDPTPFRVSDDRFVQVRAHRPYRRD
jgi:bis(5'-nucleosyl)-tetraphosphatase (symmetrical)